jgi:arsenite-transporting ATPase
LSDSDALSALIDKRLLLVTGKGGIGKTLSAAALGQLAASRGKRVLIVEAAGEASIPPLFGKTAPIHVEVSLAPGLSTLNLDPAGNFRDYVVKHLGQPRLFDKVFNNKVVQSFISAIPGFAEVMLLGRLYYECELQPTPPDLVIFDGYASGHFLSLMTTPDAVLESDLGGPLARETDRVKKFLGDAKKAAVIYVTVAEELIVSECLEFLPLLKQKSPVAPAALFVNRLPPPAVLGDGAAAAYAERRAASSRAARATLEQGLARLAEGGLPLMLRDLKELGFVDEPLAADFGRTWLEGGVGG